MKRCLVAGPPKGDRLMRDVLQPYTEAIEPWRQWRGLERIAPSQPCLRSEEHTSELQSLMRISYAVFCLKKKKHNKQTTITEEQHEDTTINTHRIKQHRKQ